MAFISTAMAATPSTTTGTQGASSLSTLVVLAVFFVIFYFLMVRPQQKKAKEHRNLINNLSKGDEVITSGGLLGIIKKVTEDYMVIELAEGVEVKVQKQAVNTCLPKGTLKSI